MYTHGLSGWQDASVSRQPFSELDSNIRTNTLIIGGGFTGLSAARDLLARGVSCVVLDANHIGYGASGRTGGFCVPRYKKHFNAIVKEYGNETALALYRMVFEAVDSVEETVETFGIDCDWQRSGHLTPADKRSSLASLEEDTRWVVGSARDALPQLYDQEATQAATGSSHYLGAYFDPRGGCLQPYRYTYGLARELAKRGMEIHIHSPVTRILCDDGLWLVETPKGTVKAEKVVIATNAYGQNSLFEKDDLHKRIVPVASSVIMTRALSSDEQALVLPDNVPVTDTSRVVSYYRKLPSGQLLFGGRGDITGKRQDIASFRPVVKQMNQMFPALEDIEIEHHWSGYVAVTLDDFPHVGEIAPGIYYGMGYCGRGVALTSMVGRRLASMSLGEDPPNDPISTGIFRPIPFHRFKRVGMLAMLQYYSLRDRFDR